MSVSHAWRGDGDSASHTVHMVLLPYSVDMFNANVYTYIIVILFWGELIFVVICKALRVIKV